MNWMKTITTNKMFHDRCSDCGLMLCGIGKGLRSATAPW